VDFRFIPKNRELRIKNGKAKPNSGSGAKISNILQLISILILLFLKKGLNQYGKPKFVQMETLSA
jgi:hypothetical protein